MCQNATDPLIEKEDEEFDPLVSLPTSTYTLLCVIFLTIAFLGACSISHLTFVFGMLGAWDETILNYIFPGLIYLKASHQFCNGTPMTKAVALFFATFGFGFFFLSNYYNALKIDKMW